MKSAYDPVKRREHYLKNKERSLAFMVLWKQNNSDRKRELNRAYYLRNKEAVIQRTREFKKKNPECIKESSRRYRLKYPEKIKEKNRLYKLNNPTANRDRQRRWRDKCREHANEWARNWRKKNPVKASENRSRAAVNRLAKIRNAIMEDCSAKIALLKQERFCRWCCQALTKENRTIDHVVPINRGGRHCPDNLVAACRSCNSRRKDKLVSEWLPFAQFKEAA